MHEHFATLLARSVHPFTNRGKLGLERIDAVIAHPLNIEDLNAAFAFLSVKATPPFCPSGHYDGIGCFCWDRRSGLSCRGIGRGWDERTFTDRNHMGDAKSVEHVRIRCVVPAGLIRYEEIEK
jgi:hypothetical protein